MSNIKGQFRKNRIDEKTRMKVRETFLTGEEFIQPFFVIEGENKKEAIPSMLGISRFSIDNLLIEIQKYIRLGGKSVLLFGIPSQKDELGSMAYHDQGIVQQAIRAIKADFPELIVISDVCMCSYTSHGHCGIIENNEVSNDFTLPYLSRIALSHAQAGADIVAPSDMMDFRVKAIRQHLNNHRFENVKIMSYSAKYCSAYYGPFRDAADSSPQFGDRRTYQMDCSNQKEALSESLQDIAEGADYVMVKPALAYLDVVSLLKNNCDVPVVAYNVSGEYSMIKAAAAKGWIDEEKIVLETMTSMKRAGASKIISYHTMDILNWLKEKSTSHEEIKFTNTL